MLTPGSISQPGASLSCIRAAGLTACSAPSAQLSQGPERSREGVAGQKDEVCRSLKDCLDVPFWAIS